LKQKLNDWTSYYPIAFTAIFISIIIQYNFFTVEAIFYDFWNRIDFGVKWSRDIVIVTLDEESDLFLGESFPYSYSSHLKFLERVITEKYDQLVLPINL